MSWRLPSAGGDPDRERQAECVFRLGTTRAVSCRTVMLLNLLRGSCGGVCVAHAKIRALGIDRTYDIGNSFTTRSSHSRLSPKKAGGLDSLRQKGGVRRCDN